MIKFYRRNDRNRSPHNLILRLHTKSNTKRKLYAQQLICHYESHVSGDKEYKSDPADEFKISPADIIYKQNTKEERDTRDSISN